MPLDAAGHGELTEVWRDVDRDPDIDAVVLCGAGKAFSAGGDFTMIEEMMDDFAVRARVWREARDLVYNIVNCSKPIVSAIQGPAVGAGLVAALLSDIPHRRTRCTHHRWAHPAGSRRRGPCRHPLAATLRHGESEVSPAVV